MFTPWVGNKFGSGNDPIGAKRILVVGESHYDDYEERVGQEVPEMTRDAMRLYESRPAGKRWVRTFDNVAWAVSGKNRIELEANGKRGELDVWNSLAFYNYIPVVLAKSARSTRPTSQQFRDGQRHFETVLSEVRPQILLVCGYELFPWVIRNHYAGYDGDPWSFTGEWIDLPHQPPVRAVRMLHPSAAFSSKTWHGVIKRALER
ncbi:hypothetical protein [Mesorhizobium sp. 10J20-29]